MAEVRSLGGGRVTTTSSTARYIGGVGPSRIIRSGGGGGAGGGAAAAPAPAPAPKVVSTRVQRLPSGESIITKTYDTGKVESTTKTVSGEYVPTKAEGKVTVVGDTTAEEEVSYFRGRPGTAVKLPSGKVIYGGTPGHTLGDVSLAAEKRVQTYVGGVKVADTQRVKVGDEWVRPETVLARPEKYSTGQYQEALKKQAEYEGMRYLSKEEALKRTEAQRKVVAEKEGRVYEPLESVKKIVDKLETTTAKLETPTKLGPEEQKPEVLEPIISEAVTPEIVKLTEKEFTAGDAADLNKWRTRLEDSATTLEKDIMDYNAYKAEVQAEIEARAADVDVYSQREIDDYNAWQTEKIAEVDARRMALEERKSKIDADLQAFDAKRTAFNVFVEEQNARSEAQLKDLEKIKAAEEAWKEKWFEKKTEDGQEVWVEKKGFFEKPVSWLLGPAKIVAQPIEGFIRGQDRKGEWKDVVKMQEDYMKKYYPVDQEAVTKAALAALEDIRKQTEAGTLTYNEANVMAQKVQEGKLLLQQPMTTEGPIEATILTAAGIETSQGKAKELATEFEVYRQRKERATILPEYAASPGITQDWVEQKRVMTELEKRADEAYTKGAAREYGTIAAAIVAPAIIGHGLTALAASKAPLVRLAAPAVPAVGKVLMGTWLAGEAAQTGVGIAELSEAESDIEKEAAVRRLTGVGLRGLGAAAGIRWTMATEGKPLTKLFEAAKPITEPIKTFATKITPPSVQVAPTRAAAGVERWLLGTKLGQTLWPSVTAYPPGWPPTVTTGPRVVPPETIPEWRVPEGVRVGETGELYPTYAEGEYQYTLTGRRLAPREIREPYRVWAEEPYFGPEVPRVLTSQYEPFTTRATRITMVRDPYTGELKVVTDIVPRQPVVVKGRPGEEMPGVEEVFLAKEKVEGLIPRATEEGVKWVPIEEKMPSLTEKWFSAVDTETGIRYDIYPDQLLKAGDYTLITDPQSGRIIGRADKFTQWTEIDRPIDQLVIDKIKQQYKINLQEYYQVPETTQTDIRQWTGRAEPEAKTFWQRLGEKTGVLKPKVVEPSVVTEPVVVVKKAETGKPYQYEVTAEGVDIALDVLPPEQQSIWKMKLDAAKAAEAKARYEALSEKSKGGKKVVEEEEEVMASLAEQRKVAESQLWETAGYVARQQLPVIRAYPEYAARTVPGLATRQPTLAPEAVAVAKTTGVPIAATVPLYGLESVSVPVELPVQRIENILGTQPALDVLPELKLEYEGVVLPISEVTPELDTVERTVIERITEVERVPETEIVPGIGVTPSLTGIKPGWLTGLGIPAIGLPAAGKGVDYLRGTMGWTVLNPVRDFPSEFLARQREKDRQRQMQQMISRTLPTFGTTQQIGQRMMTGMGGSELLKGKITTTSVPTTQGLMTGMAGEDLLKGKI